MITATAFLEALKKKVDRLEVLYRTSDGMVIYEIEVDGQQCRFDLDGDEDAGEVEALLLTAHSPQTDKVPGELLGSDEIYQLLNAKNAVCVDYFALRGSTIFQFIHAYVVTADDIDMVALLPLHFSGGVPPQRPLAYYEEVFTGYAAQWMDGHHFTRNPTEDALASWQGLGKTSHIYLVLYRGDNAPPFLAFNIRVNSQYFFHQLAYEQRDLLEAVNIYDHDSYVLLGQLRAAAEKTSFRNRKASEFNSASTKKYFGARMMTLQDGQAIVELRIPLFFPLTEKRVSGYIQAIMTAYQSGFEGKVLNPELFG